MSLSSIHISTAAHASPSYHNLTNMHVPTTGPFVEDWVSMNLTEALDYFTMHEVCKIAGHTTCIPVKGTSIKLLLPGGGNDSCGIHELPNIHSGAMCGNLPGNLWHHMHHQPWPSTRGFLDLMKLMIDRGDDTLLLIGTCDALELSSCYPQPLFPEHPDSLTLFSLPLPLSTPRTGDSVTRYHFYDAMCTAKRGGLYVQKYHANQTHARDWYPHPSVMDGAYIYPTIRSRDLHRPIFRILHFLLDTAERGRENLLFQGWLVKYYTTPFILSFSSIINHLSYYHSFNPYFSPFFIISPRTTTNDPSQCHDEQPISHDHTQRWFTHPSIQSIPSIVPTYLPCLSQVCYPG